MKISVIEIKRQYTPAFYRKSGPKVGRWGYLSKIISNLCERLEKCRRVRPAAADPRTLLLAQATPRLINAFRVRGHMLADIDPLARLERHEHPELTPAWYGLTDADLR